MENINHTGYTAVNLTEAAIQPSLFVRSVVVAQLVESKLVELVVAGSNPVGHPNFRRNEASKPIELAGSGNAML